MPRARRLGRGDVESNRSKPRQEVTITWDSLARDNVNCRLGVAPYLNFLIAGPLRVTYYGNARPESPEKLSIRAVKLGTKGVHEATIVQPRSPKSSETYRPLGIRVDSDRGPGRGAIILAPLAWEVRPINEVGNDGGRDVFTQGAHLEGQFGRGLQVIQADGGSPRWRSGLPGKLP